MVADVTHASKGEDSTLPLNKQTDLGSHGVRDLAEDPSKIGDSGGRIDHVARKADALPSEAPGSILSCLAGAKYLYVPLAT